MRIISYLAGYGFSLVVGSVIIWYSLKYLYQKYGKDKNFDIWKSKEKYRFLPLLLGIFERVLYTTAWLFGPKEFLIFWFLAKVGCGWIVSIRVRSTSSLRETEAVIRYNGFLIGNTLSIIFGIFGALIIEYWPVLFN